MSTLEQVFLISVLFVVALVLLFHVERKNGKRFGEHLRIRTDYIVLKATKYVHTALNYTGRDFVRQVAHYLFHTILRNVLEFTRSAEKGLRNMIRINKTLAKRAERESVTRTKLEEIAIHKVATALTEDEKRIRREKELRGHPHQ
ncbi:hypothetical protein IPH92_00110 [Candidatus Kaiserbacteria bacterium]|nr:MAG: hypothetical protein IPH92_00110 [Candidatus Kaiserbacteria bacterium]